MALTRYLVRAIRMDRLILLKATGTPEEFASKLGIHRSTLFQTLQEMRILGADIRYSNQSRTYYYAGNRRIKINLENVVPEGEIPQAPGNRSPVHLTSIT